MPDEIDTSNMSAEEIAELQKQNCIFCRIATKQIPAKILHEDDRVICVLDINPASEGHILVYPKEHYMILPHLPEDLLVHLFKTAKLMSNTILKTLQVQGTSVFIANGMAAGQKAPHVLIHVFPRKQGDGLLMLPTYEMNAEQTTKLKSGLAPYLGQIFGKKVQQKKETQPKEKKGEQSEAKKEMQPETKKEHSGQEKKKPKKGSVDLDDIAKLFGG